MVMGDDILPEQLQDSGAYRSAQPAAMGGDVLGLGRSHARAEALAFLVGLAHPLDPNRRMAQTRMVSTIVPEMSRPSTNRAAPMNLSMEQVRQEEDRDREAEGDGQAGKGGFLGHRVGQCLTPNIAMEARRGQSLRR